MLKYVGDSEKYLNTRILSDTSFNVSKTFTNIIKEMHLADHYLTRTGRARYI